MTKLFVWIFFVALSQGTGDYDTSKLFFGHSTIESKVTFQLYTRGNPNNGIKIPLGNSSQLLNSGFKGSRPTVVCVHGYYDSEKTGWVVRTKKGILEIEDVNFITVDYSSVSHNLLYDELVYFSKLAGQYTGQFLKFLETHGKADLRKVHLIGHSLGAQLVGFAARAFPTKKTIGRITGLDPAGPLFEHAPETERLNSDSAMIVDVIHTCKFFVGMKRPIGTIDFYPNGGFGQKGCHEFDLRCQHASAHKYFHETISKVYPNKYIANKCDSLNNAFNGSCYGESSTMGYYLKFKSPGIYYIKIQ